LSALIIRFSLIISFISLTVQQFSNGQSKING
jgi:hypothetical protein